MPDSESARRGGSNERTFSEKCSKTKKIIFSTVYVLMKHKMTCELQASSTGAVRVLNTEGQTIGNIKSDHQASPLGFN